jgi:VanZ family protein
MRVALNNSLPGGRSSLPPAHLLVLFKLSRPCLENPLYIDRIAGKLDTGTAYFILGILYFTLNQHSRKQ